MEINWRLIIDSKVHVIITCTFESIINLIIYFQGHLEVMYVLHFQNLKVFPSDFHPKWVFINRNINPPNPASMVLLVPNSL